MAQGKRPPNPFNQSDTDLVAFLEIIEAMGNGAEIEPDAPVARMTAVSFGRIAEAAVENNTKDLAPGTVGDFKDRARQIVDSALAEECWLSGARMSLDTLLLTGDISPEAFAAKTALFPQHYEDLWRNAARHCALILREIEGARNRRGKKGRPPASRNGDALAHLLDLQILRDAINLASQALPPGTRPDRDAIARVIPDMVREYTRLGQLRRLGSTEKENVDRHSRRLRNLLDSLPDKPASRSSSIKRKPT